MLNTKILLLGADAVGKTKLLYKLKLNKDIITIPTIGFNVETINYRDREITLWDIGGGSKIKYLWHHYFNNANGIIFIMDISKKERFEYYQECFKVLLDQIKVYKNIPIIIFGNKFNNIIQFAPVELLQKAEIPPEVCPYIIEGNVLTGEGLTELLDYIYDNIEFSEKEVKDELKNEDIEEEKEKKDNEEQKNNEFKIVMFGLDDSGKTNILYLLKLNQKVTTIPTIGFNVEVIENKNWENNLCIYDVGGKEQIRPLWVHYLNNLKGLIWVYDINNINNLEESQNELVKILSNQTLNDNIPLLIYANKNDQNVNDIKTDNFENGIEEYLNKRPYYIQLCNYNDVETYKNGLNWLYENIK